MIKQEALFNKIGTILNELNEQYQFLAQNPENLSELELELLQANASFLADHIQILNKIVNNQSKVTTSPNEVVKVNNENNDQNQKIAQEDNIENIVDHVNLEEFESNLPKIESVEKTAPAFEEIRDEIFKLDNTPSTFEFILNDHSEHETIEDQPQIENDSFVRDSFITNENKINTDEKFEFEEKSVDEIFNRPLSGEEERILAEKKKLSNEPIKPELDLELDEEGPEPFLVVKETEVFPIVEEDLTLELSPVPKPLVQSDELVIDPTNKPTLNDLLAGKAKAKVIHTDKPAITDLKQAVNLNDKLLYIKELFNGYNLAYAEAIEIANKLPNFEAADNFFQMNYAGKNNWSLKQATVDQFYELLNQRFK